MNKNEKPSFFRSKSAAVGIVICFVAVIAMVGAFTFNNYEKQMDDQVAKAEEQAEKLTEEKSEETTANDIVLPEAEGNTSTDTQEDDVENKDGQQTEGVQDNTSDVETTGDTSGLWFSEESVLEWPASGAVLINYSMDQTVFFSTLEQYKYNPALIIGGEVGEMIPASAAGIVTNIEETAQTGTTVTLDMGNGYSAIYGQLKDVPLAVGDYVGTGETVGYLNDPTKYYSVEGPNLYFEITKDGEPVNPLDFM